jgi:hypothetical protein
VRQTSWENGEGGGEKEMGEDGEEGGKREVRDEGEGGKRGREEGGGRRGKDETGRRAFHLPSFLLFSCPPPISTGPSLPLHFPFPSFPSTHPFLVTGTPLSPFP